LISFWAQMLSLLHANFHRVGREHLYHMPTTECHSTPAAGSLPAAWSPSTRRAPPLASAAVRRLRRPPAIARTASAWVTEKCSALRTRLAEEFPALSRAAATRVKGRAQLHLVSAASTSTGLFNCTIAAGHRVQRQLNPCVKVLSFVGQAAAPAPGTGRAAGPGRPGRSRPPGRAGTAAPRPCARSRPPDAGIAAHRPCPTAAAEGG